MKIVMTFLILTFVSSYLLGQSKTYFGVDFGVKSGIYQEIDSAGRMESPNMLNLSVDVNISQEFNERFRIETGLYYIPYNEGFKFKEESGYGAGANANVLKAVNTTEMIILTICGLSLPVKENIIPLARTPSFVPNI